MPSYAWSPISLLRFEAPWNDTSPRRNATEARRKQRNEGSRMKWFKHRTIGRKLAIAMILTSGLALLFAGSAFVINDILQARRIIQREISTTGNMLAAGSA